MFCSTGVPRLRELIDVTHKMKTPSLTIALTPQYLSNRDAVTYLAQTLVHTTLADLVVNASTVWEPHPLQTTLPQDQEMVEIANIFRNHALMQTSSRWVVRLVLNKSAILKRRLAPVDVANSVREFVGERADIIYSPTNADEWVLRVAFFDIHHMATLASTEEKQQTLIERVLTQTEMSRLLNSAVMGGVPGISEATVREVNRSGVNEAGEVVRKKEFFIDTQGTGLLEVWALDGVDYTRTISNDLHEIYETMGIEAAAQVLFQEIKTVLSFDGSYVNERHIMMAVKTMCFRGYLMPMSRHGINRVDTGVMMRVSFEESMEMLMNAAVFNEVDHLKGITENMIVGSRAPMGTGTAKLHIPEEYAALMKKQVYGRVKEPTRKQRILRSMITQWNVQSTVPLQDDLDQLDRPPSPPSTPPWAIQPPDVSDVDVFPTQSRVLPLQEPLLPTLFLPPPMPPGFFGSTPMDIDAQCVNLNRKRYRPSSPVVDEILSEDGLLESTSSSHLEFTRLSSDERDDLQSTRRLKRYRPSSPELTVSVLDATRPVPDSDRVASFIPLGGPALMPFPASCGSFMALPPALFASLLPQEPATEVRPSESLLSTEELSGLLDSLAPYLKSPHVDSKI